MIWNRGFRQGLVREGATAQNLAQVDGPRNLGEDIHLGESEWPHLKGNSIQVALSGTHRKTPATFKLQEIHFCVQILICYFHIILRVKL